MTSFTDMNCHFPELKLKKQMSLQSLWSGYGEIARYISNSLHKTVIIKQVAPPEKVSHPRGWNTPLSHQRKIRSYQVELEFYRAFSRQCNSHCRVPQFMDAATDKDTLLLVLEDIDAAGFAQRATRLSVPQIKHCLGWLAAFHAMFLGYKTDELWPIGCYWHLDTRPDELQTMADGPLKQKAKDIDRALNDAHFQTLVHGDAKLANFCFNEDFSSVAALDFQYVGGGVGIKDVMYFLGSCLDSDMLFKHEDELLDHYFSHLQTELERINKSVDFAALKQEWLALYPMAWADFHRFMAGWKPDHFKINAYMQYQTGRCLTIL